MADGRADHAVFAMADERCPDVVIAAFLAAVCRDRERGVERDLAAYQRAYPGYEVEIAASWRQLEQEHAIEPVTVDEPEIGATFAGHLLVGRLGAGGQGVVYEAHDPVMGRTVALKVLHRSRLWSQTARQRFAREVSLTARLDHPGICPVHARGVADGVPWVAMRALAGRSLASHLANLRGAGAAVAPDWREAARWVRDAADAVAHAHAQGVVHRDLKPGNLWLDTEGRVVVLDFGLAVDLRRDGAQVDLTLTGDQFGTPGYMAPEQLDGSGSSPATDVFAFGVVLHELLTCRRPFPVVTLGSYERAIQAGPPDVRRIVRGVPRDLGALLRVAMAARPGDRYVDALALRRDLDAILTGRPIAAVPPGPVRRLVRWADRERALATAIVALFVVLGVGLAVVGNALTRSQRSADRSAVTAAAALLRNQQVAAARTALQEVTGGRGGFARRLLERLLDDGLQVPAQEAADTGALPLPLPAWWTPSADAAGMTIRSHDGRLVAQVVRPPGRGGNDVTLFDGGMETIRARLDIRDAVVTAVAFSPDDGWLWLAVQQFGAAPRSAVSAWSVHNGELLLRRDLVGGSIGALLPFADGAVALGREDGVVQVLPPGLDLDPVVLCGHRAAIMRMFATDLGFASVDAAGRRRDWDRSMSGAGRQLDCGPLAIAALAFEPNGVLHVWSRMRHVCAWRPRDMRLQPTTPVPPRPADAATPVARHGEEELLVEGARSGHLVLRQIGNNAPLYVLHSGAAAVTAVAFSPDGRSLAAGHEDGTVVVFTSDVLLPSDPRAGLATARALERLAACGHEALLSLALSSSAVAGGWDRFAEERLCQRRIGAPREDLHALALVPFAAPGLHAFVADVIGRLRRANPEVAEQLLFGEVLAALRARQFAIARERLQSPAGAAAVARPSLEVLYELLVDAGAQPSPVPAGTRADSQLLRELQVRRQPGGNAAFHWVEQRMQAGAPLMQVRAEVVSGHAPSELRSMLMQVLTVDPATNGLLTELVHQLLAWREPPPPIRAACLDWATFVSASPSSRTLRQSVALAGARLRAGDAEGAHRLLLPLVTEVADWRQADPDAVAFLALALQAKSGSAAATSWRDRLAVLRTSASQRHRRNLALLLLELDGGHR